MRKFLSLLLAMLLALSLTPAFAEETGESAPADAAAVPEATATPAPEVYPLSLETPAGVIRPGKATLLTFSVPEYGMVELLVVNNNGETVSVVSDTFLANPGVNSIWWNGTFNGVFAPEGAFTLLLRTAQGEVSVPVTIGAVAPYMTNLLSSVDSTAHTMTVDFYCSVSGLVSVGVWVDDIWTLVDSLQVEAGDVQYVWDMTTANPNTRALTLTLTGADGSASTEEHIPVLPEDFRFLQAEEEATVSPDPAQPEETQEPLEAPESIIVEPTAAPEKEEVFTPAHGSPYEGMDTTLNYWTLPMDITDEAAVWEVLSQPMTVIDGDSKTQAYLFAEPDLDSGKVAMVTRGSQGLHVLETLDNGWSLVECYSSSFHDNPVKAWNMLVQGYVKTNTLKTITPNMTYGCVVDKLTQRLYVFQDGKLLSTLLVSTGIANERQPYNETRSGEFVFASPTGGFWSDNMYCPRAIRFNDGDLLHEVPYVSRGSSKIYSVTEPFLGEKASHGCIRVQRKKTPEGINMEWLWENRKMGIKIIVWEDWQGRQLEIPSDDTLLYYNPDGGESYHSQITCYAYDANQSEMTPFTFGELDTEPYASLERCQFCAVTKRRSELEAFNALYAPGGDHDPVMTQARQKFLDSLDESLAQRIIDGVRPGDIE